MKRSRKSSYRGLKIFEEEKKEKYGNIFSKLTSQETSFSRNRTSCGLQREPEAVPITSLRSIVIGRPVIKIDENKWNRRGPLYRVTEMSRKLYWNGDRDTDCVTFRPPSVWNAPPSLLPQKAVFHGVCDRCMGCYGNRDRIDRHSDKSLHERKRRGTPRRRRIVLKIVLGDCPTLRA